MALLSVTDGFQTDSEGNISLSQEQMKTIDDQLKALQEKDKTNSEAVQKAGENLVKIKEQVASLQNELKERDSQIAALKASAGDTTSDKPAGTDTTFTAQDVFNLVKDV